MREMWEANDVCGTAAETNVHSNDCGKLLVSKIKCRGNLFDNWSAYANSSVEEEEKKANGLWLNIFERFCRIFVKLFNLWSL